LTDVTSDERDTRPGWLVVLPRIPAEPARHRMALCRDLRRSGAVLLGQAIWAVPNLPVVRPLLERIAELVEIAHGSVLVLDADGHTREDARRLEQLYVDARQQEWSEFEADCDKYLAELEHEERIGKYTLAELEEEEQSLDRLRRWYRELRSRNLLGIPVTTDPATALKICEERFDAYAEHVYAALSNPDAKS
jgi:hypothetical protein